MFLALLSAVVMQQSHLPKMLHGVYKVVCMGDSITQMGDPGHGYVSVLRGTLHRLYPDQNIEVVNVGIGGQKANDMLARWDRDVLQKAPDLVTLSVGINDVWHGFAQGYPAGDGPAGLPLEEYKKDVTEMVTSAVARHIKVMVVSPTVITEDVRRPENVKLLGYVNAEREIAKSHHLPFIDLHKVFLDRLAVLRSGPDDRQLRLTVDGVHMTADGDKLMAYEILLGMGVPKTALTDLAPAKS